MVLSFYLQQEVTADSFLVTSLSNDSIIFKKNNKERYPIASVTKLMAAVVALENIDLDEEIVLKDKMFTPHTRLSPSLPMGLSVSAENLIKASLIQSTNYAAEALTYFLENGEFVDIMNEKAEEIGMEDTFFYDAHGLSIMNQSTTADTTKLISYIHENHPDILEITRDDDFWMPCPESEMCKFMNLNIFHSHPDFIGGKTGYLHKAKQTFLCLFEVNGEIIAISLLSSEDRKEDTMKIIEWMERRPFPLN